MKDPYRVLGVDRTADVDTIRKAFKKLARKYHPDVSKEKNAEERFKEVNGAYDIVGDEKKRKLFDEFGEQSTRPGFDADQARAFSGGFPGGFPGGASAGGGFSNMDDFLSSFFDAAGGGHGRGGPRARRGADQRAELTIDFLTAISGGEREIGVPRPGGVNERLKVRIPAGVKDGGRLKLRGQGAPPPGGGPCGDLNLQLRVLDHPVLRRLGDDLEMDVPLTIHEAMAGAAITVPTPTGDVKITVPPGARAGQRLRIKGRGVQKRVPGHLYLVLRPTPPQSDDPDVLAAAKRLEEAYVIDVRKDLKV